MHFPLCLCSYGLHDMRLAQYQVNENSATGGPSTSSGAASNPEEVPDVDDDDDELDLDELDELEASLSKTSIQIREPGIETS